MKIHLSGAVINLDVKLLEMPMDNFKSPHTGPAKSKAEPKQFKSRVKKESSKSQLALYNTCHLKLIFGLFFSEEVC